MRTMIFMCETNKEIEEKIIKKVIKKSPYDEKCTEEIARIVLEEIKFKEEKE